MCNLSSKELVIILCAWLFSHNIIKIVWPEHSIALSPETLFWFIIGGWAILEFRSFKKEITNWRNKKTQALWGFILLMAANSFIEPKIEMYWDPLQVSIGFFILDLAVVWGLIAYTELRNKPEKNTSV